MNILKKNSFIAAVISLMFFLPGSTFATLIGDSVDINVAGDSVSGIIVTDGAGAEYTANSIQNLPDESITFDFQDHYIDMVLSDLTSGNWLWLDAGPTFNITLSSLDIPEFGGGIAGLSITGDDFGMVDAFSVLTPTSISLDIINDDYFSSRAFRINLHDTPVPEPSSLLLMGLGIIGFVLINRRSRTFRI